MSDEQHTERQQPSQKNQQEDILDAEAHGQEPPQSDEGILSGRAHDYDHAAQEEEPAQESSPGGDA